MTEAEWNACTHPQPMLEFLRSKASERKLRLLACACVRRLSKHEDNHDEEITVLSERFADCQVGKEEVRRFRSLLGAMGGISAAWAESNASHGLLEESGWEAAHIATSCGAFYFSLSVNEYFFRRDDKPDQEVLKAYCQSAANAEQKNQAEIIREVIGSPFRPITLDPAWLTSAVTALAQAIYTDRAFDRLPILADALEDAGCTNQDILNHCRGAGPHVLGCWVVDLVLAKE